MVKITSGERSRGGGGGGGAAPVARCATPPRYLGLERGGKGLRCPAGVLQSVQPWLGAWICGRGVCLRGMGFSQRPAQGDLLARHVVTKPEYVRGRSRAFAGEVMVNGSGWFARSFVPWGNCGRVLLNLTAAARAIRTGNLWDPAGALACDGAVWKPASALRTPGWGVALAGAHDGEENGPLSLPRVPCRRPVPSAHPSLPWACSFRRAWRGSRAPRTRR